jgi:transcriptional regulatory protein LevR
MPFTMRLELLKSSHQISEDTHTKVFQIIELLKTQLSAETLSNATTFVTHSAIAIQRTLENKALDDLDQSIIEEVQENDAYESARHMLNTIQSNIALQFNTAESTLLLAHLCSLVKKTNLSTL